MHPPLPGDLLRHELPQNETESKDVRFEAHLHFFLLFDDRHAIGPAAWIATRPFSDKLTIDRDRVNLIESANDSALTNDKRMSVADLSTLKVNAVEVVCDLVTKPTYTEEYTESDKAFTVEGALGYEHR